jgi:hypothetical protein
MDTGSPRRAKAKGEGEGGGGGGSPRFFALLSAPSRSFALALLRAPAPAPAPASRRWAVFSAPRSPAGVWTTSSWPGPGPARKGGLRPKTTAGNKKQAKPKKKTAAAGKHDQQQKQKLPQSRPVEPRPKPRFAPGLWFVVCSIACKSFFHFVQTSSFWQR